MFFIPWVQLNYRKHWKYSLIACSMVKLIKNPSSKSDFLMNYSVTSSLNVSSLVFYYRNNSYTDSDRVIQNTKPNKTKTLALAWIYLKTFGQITKSLCDELFWVFEKEDLKHALACFIFVDDDGDNDGSNETDLIVKNIKMRFNKFLQAEYKGTIIEWTKEMYSMVRSSRLEVSKDQPIYLFICSMANYFQGHSTSKFTATKI